MSKVRAIYPSGEEGTGVEVKGPPAGTRLQVPKPTESEDKDKPFLK